MPFRSDPTLKTASSEQATAQTAGENPVLGFLSGVTKGVASLPFRAMELGKSIAYGAGKVAQKIPIPAVQEYGKKVTDYQEQGKAPTWLKSITEVPGALKPSTGSQKVGYAAENIGEFFLPTGLEAKGASLLSKAGPILETGLTKLDKIVKGGLSLSGKALGSGAEFAGKQALQSTNEKAVKEAGVIGLLTPPVIKGITATANKVAPVAASILAEMIGKEPEHIVQAFKNPVEVAKKIAEKVVPHQVREKAVAALNSYRTTFTKAFSDGLEALQKTSGEILPLTQRSVAKSVGTLVQDATKGLPGIFRKMGVSVLKGGVLDFEKMNSAIVSGSERKNLQMVFDTLLNQNDFSPKGMQAIAARINALTEFVEGSKNMSSKIVAEIHNMYSKAIQQVYPELAKLRASYSTATEIYSGIDEILKSVKNEIADPGAVTTATKKLGNLFAEDNDAYLEAIKRLEQISGVDLLNDLAATEFKNLVPRRFGSVMMQAGAIAGGLFYNPLVFAVLPLFSPKLMGKIVTTAGKIAPYAEKTMKSIPKLLTPIIK